MAEKRSKSATGNMDARGEDAHRAAFGKDPEDVVYSDEHCPVCDTRIDEFGFCSCGAGQG